MKNGHTVCPECIQTVSVRNGLIGYHLGNGGYRNARSKCPGHKQKARWVEEKSLNAMGRNTAGDCMKCGGAVADGANPDCTQCCYEKRHSLS